MTKRRDHENPFSVEKATEQVDALEGKLNELSIFTRRLDLYPFDTVAGEILANAIALCRSAILLIENGYSDEAYGLCRSLYECSIYLRYITRDSDQLQKRSNEFLEFGVKSKAFWFHLLKKDSSLTDEARSAIERYKAENSIPDNPKMVTQPWSGIWKPVEKTSSDLHPTDSDTSTEALREKDRALAYTGSSAYVHCTQPGLNTYSYEWKEPMLIRKFRTPKPDTVFPSCMVIQIHLNEIARYCFFGLGMTV